MHTLKISEKLYLCIFIFSLCMPFIVPMRTEAAVHRVAPGGSINKTVTAAKPGDTIEIMPGIYNENIKVTKKDLSFVAAGEFRPAPLQDIFKPDSERDVVITGKSGVLLADSNNTLWRGICFVGGEKLTLIADLQKFTGRFENCRFNFDETADKVGALVSIIGGSPTFHASVFANQYSPKAAVFVSEEESAKVKTEAVFTYCVFQDLGGGGAVAMDRNAHGSFLNCLFLRNNSIVARESGSTGDVRMDNCVFFLNMSPDEFATRTENSPPVSLRNCIFTPGFSPAITPPYYLKPEDFTGAIATDCQVVSPRFLKGRRDAVMTLGIDDTQNLDLWSTLCGMADAYDYPITLSVNTYVADKRDKDLDIWDKLKEKINQRHEIASHTVSHAPLTLRELLQVRYYRPNINSAMLSISTDSVMRITAGETVIFEIDFKEEDLTMGQLMDILNKSGVEAALVDPYCRDIPARLLAPQDEIDIYFENFSIPLIADRVAYITYETNTSRQILLKRLEGFMEANVIVYPHTLYDEDIRKIAAEAGFTIARAGQEAGCSPYEGKGVNLMSVWAVRSLGVMHEPVISQSETRRKYLMIIDYFKDLGIWGGFYSHGADEVTLDNWGAILQAISDDGDIRVVTLDEILNALKEQGVSDSEMNYTIPPAPDMSDYHPRPDSPMIGAGIDVGLISDFEGKPIPKGKRPNIGIYE